MKSLQALIVSVTLLALFSPATKSDPTNAPTYQNTLIEPDAPINIDAANSEMAVRRALKAAVNFGWRSRDKGFDILQTQSLYQTGHIDTLQLR
jgi:hypothetical protein